MTRKPTTAKRVRREHSPSGVAGERVSEYPTLTVRIPWATKHALRTLCALRGVPVWKMLDTTIRAYMDALPTDERRILAQFARQLKPR
jgi:hypothetical protein